MGEASRKKRLEREKRNAMEFAKTPAGLAYERELYSQGWSHDSGRFEEAGDYDWMASQVAGHERILEIGTGNGGGTLALLKGGHTVVSIDENTACLQRAESKINAAGFQFQLELRGTISAVEDGYAIQYTPIPSVMTSNQLMLIEGDTLNDPCLNEWLEAGEPFDAIVCWLIGSHRARQLNTSLTKDDAGTYRLRVQNALYLLADRILRPGGLLHTVDRRNIPVSNTDYEIAIADLHRSHSEQAEDTSLQVDANITHRPYAPAKAPGVPMGLTPGLSGYTPKSEAIGLFSVIARKTALDAR